MPTNYSKFISRSNCTGLNNILCEINGISKSIVTNTNEIQKYF